MLKSAWKEGLHRQAMENVRDCVGLNRETSLHFILREQNFGAGILFRRLPLLAKSLTKSLTKCRWGLISIPGGGRFDFFDCKTAPIAPLIEELDFIKNKTHWGYPFRRGLFKIEKTDFERIAQAMEAELQESS